MARFAKSWRDRWYVYVPPGSRNDSTGVPLVQEWVLKLEVKVWLDSRPLVPLCWEVPHPGSPGLPMDFTGPVDQTHS